MTVPRAKIVERITANVDVLLSKYSNRSGEAFLNELYDPFRSSGNSGAASPFIKTLFPEIKVAATLERALNTALGWGWDKVAHDIAEATHGNGEHSYDVKGELPVVTTQAIEGIVNSYRDRPRKLPDTDAELAAILPSVSLAGPKEAIEERDDAFYIDANGVESHIEIKTPKPNYDQMKAAKRRILRVHALRAKKKVRAFVGFPYNPNGRYGPYGWPTTGIYLDPARDMLVGEAFWNYIGDSPDTYDELLDCFYTVGRARRSELIDLLRGE